MDRQIERTLIDRYHVFRSFLERRVESREAADRLQISAGNARVRPHRARGAPNDARVACCEKCSENGCLDCGCATNG